MIELTDNIGDNRRCSLTAWKVEEWQALSMASGLPQPSRIQDYTSRGKIIGQAHYFLIEELPRILAWLQTTGRAYRVKNFNEVIPPSAEQVKFRTARQVQEKKAAEVSALKLLKQVEEA